MDIMAFIDQVVILLVGLMPLTLILALVVMVLGLTIFESEYGVVRLWIIATLIAYIAEWVNVFESMNCGRIQVLCTHAWLLPGWAYFIWLVIGVVTVIVVKAQENERVIENNKHVAKAWRSRGLKSMNDERLPRRK